MSKLQADLKQEYRILAFVRGLKQPSEENEEIKATMLKQIYLVQMTAIGASLIPTLICLVVKMTEEGYLKAHNFFMGLVVQVTIVMYAWLNITEKY